MRAAALLLLAALPGCADSADAPAEPAETAAPDEAAATGAADLPLPDDYAGTAWQVSDADGARYTTFLDPDGTYRDLRNGDPFQEGSWSFDAEERLCFTTPAAGDASQDEGEQEVKADKTCWRPHRMAGDDELVLHGQSGRRIKAIRVDYSPADEDNDDAAG